MSRMNRMKRLADLPFLPSTDFVARDGDDDTVVIEGEVLDFLLNERVRLKGALRSARWSVDQHVSDPHAVSSIRSEIDEALGES